MGFGAAQGGASTALTNPMNATGDIIVGGATGTPARLAKGADGTVLTLASGTPSWAAAGGGGSGTILFVNRAITSVSDGNEVSIISGTSTGSRTIAAGGMTAGKVLRVRVGGTMNLVSGHGAFIYLYLGSTIIGSIFTGTLGGTDITGDQQFEATITVVVRTADSTTYADGSWLIKGRNFTTGSNIDQKGIDNTDKSAGGTLDVTWDFSSTNVGDNCEVLFLSIEALN